VQTHVEFLPDPLGVEAVGHPIWLAENIRVFGVTQGDCDDAAVLAGALVRSVGRPVRLAVASFRPDRRLHHVWAEGYGTSWHQLDPFRSERFVGRLTRLETHEV
jgi:transglutaminase-like putative cysteine protease